jgi:hypothetical protein
LAVTWPSKAGPPVAVKGGPGEILPVFCRGSLGPGTADAGAACLLPACRCSVRGARDSPETRCT